MSHKSPNHLQVALLYDNADGLDLRKMLETFQQAEEKAFGHKYNIVEFNEKTGYFRCYGGRDIMIFVEKIDAPANRACFNATLGSVFTKLVSPEAPGLIDRHRAHVLINVHNGAMPPDPKIKALLAQLNVSEAGQSLPQYRERLRVLGALASITTQIHAPLLSHWTYSEMLADPAKLGDMMLSSDPSPLHIHPLPYRAPGTTQEQGVAGLTTHGASYYIGRELRVRPHTVPWIENFQSALAFVRIAIAKNGYIIPDGDTFSDEANTVCFRVHHDAEPIPNGQETVPCYELELMVNQKHGFVSPDYVPLTYTVDLDAPRSADPSDPRTPENMREWTETRRMAERAGVQLEVKINVDARDAQGVKVFGRRNIEQAQKGGWLKRRFFH
jgi:hypothetical protein